MTQIDEARERRDFEATYETWDLRRFVKPTPGFNYKNHDTQVAWDAWFNRAAAPAAAIDQAVAAQAGVPPKADLAFYSEGAYILLYTGERARQMALSHAPSQATPSPGDRDSLVPTAALVQAAQLGLEALKLALSSHGKSLMSDPPKDAWKYHNVSARLAGAIAALRSVLGEA